MRLTSVELIVRVCRRALFIRVWCNWFTRRSDKAEFPGSSPGSRTTFMGCQTATAERVLQ